MISLTAAQRLAFAKHPVGMPLQGYWWVGGWIRPRNGIPPKPGKCLKNAGPTPSRVHALLGCCLNATTMNYHPAIWLLPFHLYCAAYNCAAGAV